VKVAVLEEDAHVRRLIVGVSGASGSRYAWLALRALREARGLTQRRLAHDLGISQNYIRAIEANACQAGPVTILTM